MEIAITGSSGLIGSALCRSLESKGHLVRRLVRQRPSGRGEFFWAPESGEIDMAGIEGVDAVVNLAGANIADARWTESRRQLIRESRILGTGLLVRSIAQAQAKPRVFISGSAIGFYGEQGDKLVNESHPGGSGFLAEVGRDWEAAALPAMDAGVRVVLLRTGIVLSPKGGALAKLLPVFRLGLGGQIGDGRSWMSWISIDDMAGVIFHALEDQRICGPLNAVSPNPSTNKVFTAHLGKVLHRPSLLRVPAFALRLALGQMAGETILSSVRVVPTRLIQTGFKFRHDEIGATLADLLGRVE